MLDKLYLNLKTIANQILSLKNERCDDSREKGQTAILSVIFFTIIMSVITVGFMQIVSAEQSQATNNELQASARAAAESGIEDGKRAISYCEANTSVSACHNASGTGLLDNANANNCTVVTNVLSSINSSVESNPSQVGAAYNEKYSCLTAVTQTGDINKTISPQSPQASNQSLIVPLTGTSLVNGSGLNSIVIAWHNTLQGPNLQGPACSALTGTDIPSATTWNSSTTPSGCSGSPAIIRVEVVAVPNSSFSISSLIQNDRATAIRPTSSSNLIGGTLVSESNNDLSWAALNNQIDSYNMQNFVASPQSNASASSSVPFSTTTTCQSGNSGYVNTNPNVSSGPYACAIAITDGFNMSNYSYYLRIQSVTGVTNADVSAYDASGNNIKFDTQPIIDSTGQASDSFQRLQARLDSSGYSSSTPNANGWWWPNYSVDSAGTVCKQINVLASDGSDSCSSSYN